MKHGETLKKLIFNLREDCRNYEAFRGLLDQQFHAALAHDGAEMSEVNANIVELADRLAANLDARRALAAAVAGCAGPVSIEDLLAVLQGEPRKLLISESVRFAAHIEQCKWLNERNATLLVNQQEIMRAMTAEEDEIYGPD